MGIALGVEPHSGPKTRNYVLMVYAALFGAISSVLTAGYITLYHRGINFFQQVSLFVLDINIWPLVLLTGAGVLIGLLIKFFGERGGLGFLGRNMLRRAASNPGTCPVYCLKHS